MNNVRFTLFSVIGLAAACGAEPAPKFAVVPVSAVVADAPRRKADLPVDDAKFDVCEKKWQEVKVPSAEVGVEATRPLVPGTTVRVAAFDVANFDGANVDQVLKDALSVGRKGRNALACRGSGKSSRTPALCSGAVEADRLIPASLEAALCEPKWMECLAALNTEAKKKDSEVEGSVYETDVRFIESLDWSSIGSCACGDPPEVLSAAETAIADFDSSAVREYDRVLGGDASLTVSNAARVWDRKNQAADPAELNAGICGMWVYSDDAFAELSDTTSKSDKEPVAAKIEEYCGGVPLPESVQLSSQGEEGKGGADDDEAQQEEPDSELREGPAPLTILGWIEDGRGYRRLGGVGDLTGAYVLQGVDHSSRACPQCKKKKGGDRCEVSAGAVRLNWGDDLRHRAAQQGERVHVLIAECSPPQKEGEAEWQRACWHAELEATDLAAGKHISIDVGGITKAVSRTVEE